MVVECRPEDEVCEESMLWEEEREEEEEEGSVWLLDKVESD